MNYELRHNGFSLTEVLIAVGILAVGLVFIAGTFPVGIGLTTVAAERTIGAIAADEAFTKIRLYDVDVGALKADEMTDFNDVPGSVLPADAEKMFAYPSVDSNSPHSYYWSALCRRIDEDSRLVQVTVFVCRKTGMHSRYPKDDPDVAEYDWPKPVFGQLMIRPIANRFRVHPIIVRFFNKGSTIVADKTGSIYRILRRLEAPNELIIELDRDRQEEDMGGEGNRYMDVWVVPPAVGGGRNPTIGVYQKVIKF
jgi:prepilin-type N-terminal cleavage/methylation domain-containing protein